MFIRRKKVDVLVDLFVWERTGVLQDVDDGVQRRGMSF